MNTNSAAEFGIKFRVVELKTPRFSTAIGLNLYAEDWVEYYYYYYYYAAFTAPCVSHKDERVYRFVLSVCMSVREHISGTACPIFSKFIVRVN